MAKQYEAEGRVLILAPEDLYGLNTLKKNFEGLEMMYRKGYAAAEAIPELEYVGFREYYRPVNGVAVSVQRIVKGCMRTVVFARLNLQGQHITVIGLYQEIQLTNPFFREVIEIGKSMRGEFLRHDILVDSAHVHCSLTIQYAQC